MSLRAMIFDVQRGSYVDGPGIRTTVFVKGCNLRCAWCHNPESQAGRIERMWYAGKCTRCGKCAAKCRNGALTQDPSDGSLHYDKEKCTLCGRCALFCPNSAAAVCGREADTDELMSVIASDKSFYDASGGGMTVSGGECMLYPDFLAELLEKCRREGIHTAVDTAGNVPFEQFEKILPFADLFLYDIKAVTPELHKKYTGADNARILDNYKRLLSLGARIIVRVPMIAEVNANAEEFPKIASFLADDPPQSVELLPYHAMGENKFRAVRGEEPPFFHAPSDAELAEFRRVIADALKS